MFLKCKTAKASKLNILISSVMYTNNKIDPNAECKPKHTDIMTKVKFKILICVTMVFQSPVERDKR